MLSIFDNITFAIVVLLTLVAIIAAFRLGAQWQQENTDKLGFVWGYFTVLSTLMGNVFVLFYVIINMLEAGAVLDAIYCTLLILALCFVAYKALLRSRWALVLMTLFSFNIAVYIINSVYLRNRWAELQPANVDGADILSTDAKFTVNRFSKKLRLSIFLIITWVLGVGIVVLLFETYGSRMDDAEMMHMLMVMFLPSLALLGMYWIYDTFIR